MEKVSQRFSLVRKLLFTVLTGAVCLATVLLILDSKPVVAPALTAPVTNLNLLPQLAEDEPVSAGNSRFVVAANAEQSAANVANSSTGPSSPAQPTESPVQSPAQSLNQAPNQAPEQAPNQAPEQAAADANTRDPNPVGEPSTTPQRSLKYIAAAPAFTLAFPQNWDIPTWVASNEAARRFVASAVFKGLMADIMATLKVRPEDLSVGGMSGISFENLLLEVLASGAYLHYDRLEGRKGVVLSFERSKTPIVSKLLPLLVPVVARQQYAVHSLVNPVIEMQLGSQPLLLAEDKGRVYIANGLTSLMRVLDTPNLEGNEDADALTLVVRGESFLDGLLGLLSGRDEWPVRLAFLKGSERGAALVPQLRVGAAKIFAHLSPKLSEGVFAAVPRDVFGVLAASFGIKPEWNESDWQSVAASGVPETSASVLPEGGIAMLWDLAAEERSARNRVGIVISWPEGAQPKMNLSAYANSSSFQASCAGGRIWLISSNELFLTRMREACEGQSVSYLTAIRNREFDTSVLESQLFLAVNPSPALQVCYQTGLEARRSDGFTPLPGVQNVSTPATSVDGESTGAGSGAGAGSGEIDTQKAQDPNIPSWRRDYDQALERVGKEATETLRALPLVVFFGRADSQGAKLQGVLRGS